MYIIRDKNVKIILKTLKAPLEDQLSPEEVFPGFDPKTMEMAKHAKGRIPKYFDIDKKGFAQRLSKKEYEAQLAQQEGRSDSEEQVSDTEAPVDSNALSAAEMLRKKQIKSKKDLVKAEAQLQVEIENKIAEKYSAGRELKIVKGYMDWIVEGQPAKDERLKKYKAMQRHIGRVKAQFEPIKKKLAAKRQRLLKKH